MYYVVYILGVVLLCVPGAALANRKHRFATVEQIAENRGLWWSWLHALNLIDFLRALTGALLVMTAFREAAGSANEGMFAVCLIGGVGVIGALVQQFFYRVEDRLIVPVAYLAGLFFAQLPLHIAVVSLVLGIATAIATRHIGWGLLATGCSAMGMGLLFSLSKLELALICAPMFLVFAMQDVLHRRLVLSLYNRSQASGVFQRRTVEVLR